MAKIIWTEPALDQLDDIAGYIALDNPGAARELIARTFKKLIVWRSFQIQARPAKTSRLCLPGSRLRAMQNILSARGEGSVDHSRNER